MNSTTNTSNNPELKSKRNVGLDIARIIAMTAVVVLHSTHNSTAKMITCFCVLLFVMVSGALWMDESHSLSNQKLLKSILRIVIAFIFWSTAYTILFPEYSGLYGFIRQVLIGPFHFWYCYMIIGLYAIIPILKVLQKEKKIFIYFFILSFITAILLPTLSFIEPLSGFIEIVDRSQIYIGFGYVFYFILGYLLKLYQLSTILKIFYYFIGIASGIAMFYIDLGADFNILRMFYTSSIFILALELGKLIKSAKVQSVLSFLSKQCFTVYLIHIMILNLCGSYIESFANNEVLFCILIVIICFAIASILNIIWKYITEAVSSHIINK